MTEILWLERAAELAEAANQALRASHECLLEAEQARLAAERESPFAGSRDPGAPPGAFGSRSLRSVPRVEGAHQVQPCSPDGSAIADAEGQREADSVGDEGQPYGARGSAPSPIPTGAVG